MQFHAYIYIYLLQHYHCCRCRRHCRRHHHRCCCTSRKHKPKHPSHKKISEPRKIEHVCERARSIHVVGRNFFSICTVRTATAIVSQIIWCSHTFFVYVCVCLYIIIVQMCGVFVSTYMQ